jgi:hypothetical protein
MNPRRISLAHLVASLVVVASSSAARSAEVDYVRDVRPILQKHCYACHGAAKQKSGLRLDIKSEAFKGGDGYGPAIVAGDAKASPLVQLITDADADVRMPPERPPLSSGEVTTLTRWIDAGAVWPDGVDLAKLEDKRDHWSFKPLASPPLPIVADTVWPRDPLDRFILARLEQAGLRPAPEAEPAAWLRRVTYDLTGLPPTPEELQAFLAASATPSLPYSPTPQPVKESRSNRVPESAYAAVVDRLLASPRYGERWAQHWLDIVRYADTHGFEVNTERPHAWPYRDYVIAAYNDDVPYDRFVREQLAGDAFDRDPATGFLVTASVLLPGQIGKDEPSKRLARQDALDEIVVNIGQTFLGLSIGCARCHDHKFDPVTSRDYYAMQAFVAGVEYGDRPLHTPDAEAARREAEALKAEIAVVDREFTRFGPLAMSGVQRAAVNARLNLDRFAPITVKRVRFTIRATNNQEPCLDEIEIYDVDGTNVALAEAGARATASGESVVADVHELDFVNDGRYGNARSWVSNEAGRGWVEIELKHESRIERVVWSRDRTGKVADRLPTDYQIEAAAADGAWRVVADSTDRAKFDRKNKQPVPFSMQGLNAADAQQAEALLARKAKLENELAEAESRQQAFAGKFREPDVIRVLHRGDPEQPQEVVTPVVPVFLGEQRLAADATEQQRRQSLAEWIVDPKNPLTWRVAVNRIWQGHFGTGLVETASDFGRTGTKPSHPELLDYLAQEFLRAGRSTKVLHRRIVLSATYRQATAHNGVAAAQDADVRLLWRFPSLRLDAEAIRDSMLAVAGRLDLKMGGRGFDLFDKRGGLTGFKPVESFTGDGLRRMIYAHKVRRERDAVFGAFDCPDAGQSTARRRESTTPIQALNLFNSRFTIEQAAAFAERVEREAGPDAASRIGLAYRLALGRDPRSDEITAAEPIVVSHGLAVLGRALFNCNEFLFLP